MSQENLRVDVEVKIKELIAYRKLPRYRLVNGPYSYKHATNVEGISSKSPALEKIVKEIGYSCYFSKMEMVVKMVKIGVVPIAKNLITSGEHIGGLTELYTKNMYVNKETQHESAFICTFIHELAHALCGLPSEDIKSYRELMSLVQPQEAIAYATAWIIGEMWGIEGLLKPTLHGLALYGIEENTLLEIIPEVKRCVETILTGKIAPRN